MDVIEVATQRRRQLVDITSFVQRSVAAGEVPEGMCHVFIPHTTAAVLINENADPDVGDDILAALAAMLPGVPWKHAEGNSDAHVMATLVGASVLVPIADGDLALGRWQGVYLLELDGPRKREVWVTCLRA
ncbi:MAG: YjbQ family protein [Acidobacteria bacterium]|nr:YjbQ family protein [Acidobacteriota bacterium]